jgi:hypothetical protein
MIIPLLLVITAILVSNTSYNNDKSVPALTMSLKSYKNAIVPYTSSSDVIRWFIFEHFLMHRINECYNVFFFRILAKDTNQSWVPQLQEFQEQTFLSN